MRLTLVISSLGMGGAERVLSLMADYWATKGWHITLITFDVSANDFFQIPPTVTRVALDIMADAHNPMVALCNNIRRVHLLRQAILASSPDAVISFIDKINILTLLACRNSPFPVIVSERVDPRQHPIGRIWSTLRQLLYPYATVIVVQSEAVRVWTQSCFRVRTVKTIPNPVLPMPAHFDETQTIAATLPKPLIAALGRLVPQKGFDLLLQAAAPVLEKHPNWTLMILGEGPERQKLEQLATELAVSHRVKFPGYVREPIQLLRQADLFILPSHFEGFPNVLLEAMSCGLPVISTDCPSGPCEIIRDGVDGILIPVGDIEALTRVMNRLISDAAERAHLSARAPEVTSRFGLERVMGMWEELLENVVKPGPVQR